MELKRQRSEYFVNQEFNNGVLVGCQVVEVLF